MRKRVLSLLLAASAAFCFIFSSAPEAQAIVPIGFVQSALASYVSSTGYKLYNDNGTGQDILGSLGELYDDYVTVNNKTIQGSVATLAWLANSPLIYQDNSGQIVISQVAANIMQDFADWIQTEYSVTVGSDTPTVIVSGGETDWTNGEGVNASRLLCSDGPYYDRGTAYYFSPQVGTALVSGTSVPIFIASREPCTLFATLYFPSDSTSYLYISAPSSAGAVRVTYLSASNSAILNSHQQGVYSDYVFSNQFSYDKTNESYTIAVSSSNPANISSSDLSGGVAVGLGVTLAQAVADVVGQAKEDDAVVIGVGASAGATAQDIADMVAQGIKAQTLDPSVSITAEAVIDTPVQPYPDIDGLGLPTLGAALVDRFPFCIPWDFVDTVRLLSADPQPINIKVDLIPQRIKTAVGISSDTSFDIDLSGEQYAKIGVFCRWGSLITFCFGLFLLTKRLVWTA